MRDFKLIILEEIAVRKYYLLCMYLARRFQVERINFQLCIYRVS